MSNKPLIAHIAALGRPVFSARELCAVSGKSASTVSQGLDYLRRQGLAVKVAHGVWAAGAVMPSPYAVITHLLPRQRAYVSFTSALHLHGIIEQIPQAVTLASLAHSKRIKTGAGSFSVHHLAASFFRGFAQSNSGFLLAEPEKALVDCLYVSTFRKRQFTHFPELNLEDNFDMKKAYAWLKFIESSAAASHVRRRLDAIKASQKAQ